MKQTIPIKEVLDILNKQLDILKLLSSPTIMINDDILDPEILASGTMRINPNYKEKESE